VKNRNGWFSVEMLELAKRTRRRGHRVVLVEGAVYVEAQPEHDNGEQHGRQRAQTYPSRPPAADAGEPPVDAANHLQLIFYAQV